MSADRNPIQTVTVTVDMNEPDLVAATFDLIRTHACAHGLNDIASVQIEMNLTFEGWPSPSKVDAFRERLHRMWLDARVTGVVTSERPPKDDHAGAVR